MRRIRKQSGGLFSRRMHDQFANGQHFQVLNVVDDVTWECLAAIPDTLSYPLNFGH